jgi:(hydroxyamino)benzene mutase
MPRSALIAGDRTARRRLAYPGMQEALIALGLVLFLLGLLTGQAVPAVKNPRMALASHLQGMTNGPFLVVIGLLWPRLHLPELARVAAFALLAYGTYANWLATQLAAIWGAGHRFMPGATGDHRGTPAQERTVDVLLMALVPAMIVGTVLVLIGVLR